MQLKTDSCLSTAAAVSCNTAGRHFIKWGRSARKKVGFKEVRVELQDLGVQLQDEEGERVEL